MRTFDSDFEQNLYAARLQTLEKIADIGVQLGLSWEEARYPNHFPFTTTIPEIRSTYDHAPAEEFDLALAEAKPINVAIAGRIMAIRTQGKAGFAQLQQGGQRLQIYVRKDSVGELAFSLYKLLDLGDHIGVHGYLFRTRTGELTVHVGPGPHGEPSIAFLAKSLLALPDKYHGLEDVELRYRQRYVDLIMNSGTLDKIEILPTTSNFSSRPEPSRSEGVVEGPDSPTAELPPGSSPVTDTADPNNEHRDAPRNVREVFVKRAQILRSIRRFFDERGYLEVETPMMHTVAGGAAARPFKTHHNALDLDLSLRIAPELFLKRLVVGGLDRVYEINRNFRNEGVSTQHNPEFTMLEFYQAYSNYHDLMDLTQELVTRVATEVNGTPFTHFNGHHINLSQWTKLSMREAIIEFWPANVHDRPTRETFVDDRAFVGWIDHFTVGHIEMSLVPDSQVSMSRYLQLIEFLTAVGRGVSEGKAPMGKAIAEIFEYVAEPYLIQPTIIYDFPLAVSPLSKQKPDEPDWVERFEFYIGGFEVGNAFSELNDPEEQRKRFEQQLQERDRGDDEAHAMDEDYVRALGYGLPPTAGEGIGIDRLTMLLTGSRSIRDVILFPLLRPSSRKPGAESS